MNRDHGCDSGDPPDLLARIERGLFGTTDGDLVEDDAQLPVGELRRLLREVVIPSLAVPDGETPPDAVLALCAAEDAATYETSTTPGYVDSDDLREALGVTDGG